MTQPLYQRLASLVDARARCLDSLRRLQPMVMDGPNDVTAAHWREMANRHFGTAYDLVKAHMPSGAGWDCGTTFDVELSTPNHLVFHGAYHHMDESGTYDGWTEHEIHVRPSLQFGIDVRITGPNRNDVKTYLDDIFGDALRTEV